MGGKKEEERGREQRGWGVLGLAGLSVDLGFYPEGGGSPGGLWTEEGVTAVTIG